MRNKVTGLFLCLFSVVFTVHMMVAEDTFVDCVEDPGIVEDLVVKSIETDNDILKIGEVDICEWLGINKDQLQEQFPCDPAKTLVLLTHGTSAANNPWYKSGGVTHELIKKQSENLHLDQFDSFRWDQPLWGILRLEQVLGGKKMKDRVEDAVRDSGIEHVVIIAHSNGGAVSKSMSRFANPNHLMKFLRIKQIENLKSVRIITLGTPNTNNSFFEPKNVEPILNCFSISDDIQDGAADKIINTNYGINVEFQIQETDGSMTYPEHTDMYNDCMAPWLLYLHIKFAEDFASLKENKKCGVITFYRDMSKPPEFAVRLGFPDEMYARPFNFSYSILFPFVMIKEGCCGVKNWVVGKIF